MCFYPLPPSPHFSPTIPAFYLFPVAATLNWIFPRFVYFLLQSLALHLRVSAVERFLRRLHLTRRRQPCSRFFSHDRADFCDSQEWISCWFALRLSFFMHQSVVPIVRFFHPRRYLVLFPRLSLPYPLLLLLCFDSFSRSISICKSHIFFYTIFALSTMSLMINFYLRAFKFFLSPFSVTFLDTHSICFFSRFFILPSHLFSSWLLLPRHANFLLHIRWRYATPLQTAAATRS